MNNSIFGIPFPIVGGICLLIAAYYVYKKPAPPRQGRQRTGWRALVVRWGHSLVWLLLALASFIWAGWLPGGPALADALARVALLLYVLFIVTVMADRRPA